MLEEDLLVEVVHRWIDSLGLEGPDISRQAGFSVRFGRTRRETARSDVLVRQHGKPLFVVEGKSPALDLRSEDHEQVLSYARLLTPDMAPFAILTNGRQAAIIETSTGNLLQEETVAAGQWWKQPPKASSADLDLRFLAISKFISLSSHNLEAFCASQMDEATTPYRDRADIPTFRRELHVPRARCDAKVAAFLQGPRRLFKLLGEPGTGKTSELIWIGYQNLARAFPLYIPLRDARGDPVEYLAQEFSWRFSAERSPQALFRDLSSIAHQCGRALLLLVDDPEACDRETVTRGMADLMKAADASGPNTKVVLACQPATWAAMSRSQGYPSDWTRGLDLTSKDRELEPEHVLRLFDDAQRAAAFRKLQSEYRVLGDLVDSQLAELCRHPTMLRLLAMSFQGQRLPARMPSADILIEFIRWSVNRTSDPQAVSSVLRRVADVGLRGGPSESTPRPITVDEDSLRAELPEGYASALDAAVNRGLLSRRVDTHNRRTLSFGQDWLQRYVIAFHYLRIDQTSYEDVLSRCEDWYARPELRESISWYLDIADPSKRRALLSPVTNGARRFLERIRVAERSAPSVEPIGAPFGVLLIPVESWLNPAYAIQYGPAAAKPNVEWIEMPAGLPRDEAMWEAIKDKGTDGTIRSGREDLFLAPTVESVAETFAVKRLMERISECPPGWCDSPALASEIAWAIATTFSGELDLTDDIAETIPVSRIERGINFLWAKRAYELGEERRRRQRSQVSSGTSTWSISYGGEELRRLREEATRHARVVAAKGDVVRPNLTIGGNTIPIGALESAIRVLRANAVSDVAPFCSAGAIDAVRHPSLWSPPQIPVVEQLLTDLVAAGLREYRRLVKAHLPGFVTVFRRAATFRKLSIWGVQTGVPGGHWTVHVLEEQSESGVDEVDVRLLPTDDWRENRVSLPDDLRDSGRRVGANYWVTGLARVLGTRNLRPAQAEVSVSSAEERMILRNTTFAFLEWELGGQFEQDRRRFKEALFGPGD